MTPQETFQKAARFHQNGQFALAESLYLQLLEASPDQISIYPNLADVLIRQGKTEEAIFKLEKARAFAENDAGILVSLSTAYSQSGQFEPAFELINKAVGMHPQSYDAHYQLGNLLVQNNDLEGARQAFEKVVDLHPGMAYAWYNLGNISYSQGDRIKAVDAFYKATQAMSRLLPAYINLGTIFSEDGAYDEALKNYETALNFDPGYVPALKGIGMVLHVTGKLTEAESYFRKALELGGANPEILLLLAHVNRDLNQTEAAEKYYVQVLDLDPNNETAHHNLRKLQKHKIAAWHLEMLADRARNEAYDKALSKVSEGKTVLDIGTGSGLLAMMAARAGAKKVYAVEMLSILADTAGKVVKDNAYEDRIEVINRKSTALTSAAFQEKPDILVTEILDSGLLGEGVIPTHRHALESLVKDDAVVIPKAADVYGVLIQSEHYKAINPVRNISGFDLSAFDAFNVSDEYSRVLLNSIPHQKLSDVFPVLSIDFKMLPPPVSNRQPNIHEVTVRIKKAGTVEGIAFWFTLHIDDEIQLSSGPEGEMIHWGQALYFFETPKKVEAGDELKLKALQSDAKIIFAMDE